MSDTRSLRPKRAKTMRVHSRRGLHSILEVYNGVSGSHASGIGFTNYKTTYGEVTEQGINILSEKIKQYCVVPRCGNTFYDLGCGIGKVNVGMAILHPDIRSVGIEIVPERVRFAMSCLEKLKQKQIRNRILFHCGDFLSPDLNFKNAFCIFLSNMCFTEETNQHISEKIVREAPAGCILICSRELPVPAEKMVRLESNCNIPMSWSASSTCYIYRSVRRT